ncbi:MAG: DUF1156 domain-containing protein [Desulfobacterales bacterium]|nr:MAG: DUF1156 domain-containing protein [Desulfobacterales bacterium]
MSCRSRRSAPRRRRRSRSARGHISALHLWWARRPLVVCRAAMYAALVPASRFIPENGPNNKKQSLGRANAAKFMARLCRYPSESKPVQETDIERAIKEAQKQYSRSPCRAADRGNRQEGQGRGHRRGPCAASQGAGHVRRRRSHSP